MSNDKLLFITAYSPKGERRVILRFNTLEEAMDKNPGLCNFKIVGKPYGRRLYEKSQHSPIYGLQEDGE